jgi:hypothetical protein
MTKEELEAALEAKKVPKQMYSLEGLKDGECYCIVKDGDSWKVVYMERGRASDVATGLTGGEAYDTIYNEFRAMYGWP